MGIPCFTLNPAGFGCLRRVENCEGTVLGQRDEEELWEFGVKGGPRDVGLVQPRRGFGLFGVICLATTP